MVSAGRLNKRITIQTPTDSRGATGAVTTSWATAATVWAAVEPLNAKTVEIGKSFADTVSHKVIIRYRSGVAARQRISWGSRTFQVDGVINPREAKEDLELYCTELL